MIKTILSILAILSFVACGKNAQIPGQRSEQVFYVAPAESETYTYEFTKKSCSTDKKSYYTFVEVCEALTNHEINNECAQEERQELFENSECPGSF